MEASQPKLLPILFLFQLKITWSLRSIIHRSKTQQKIDQSVGKANKLQDQIEQANQKLKGKQSLDWQDKKMLEDIIDQKAGFESNWSKSLKSKTNFLEQKKDAFTEQDERIREKAEQIQKLMDELLDEETKETI